MGTGVSSGPGSGDGAFGAGAGAFFTGRGLSIGFLTFFTMLCLRFWDVGGLGGGCTGFSGSSFVGNPKDSIDICPKMKYVPKLEDTIKEKRLRQKQVYSKHNFT